MKGPEAPASLPGLLHTASFVLLVLSSERAFSVRLNEPCARSARSADDSPEISVGGHQKWGLPNRDLPETGSNWDLPFSTKKGSQTGLLVFGGPKDTASNRRDWLERDRNCHTETLFFCFSMFFVAVLPDASLSDLSCMERITLKKWVTGDL